MNKSSTERESSETSAGNRRALLENDLRRQILLRTKDFDEPLTTEIQLAKLYSLSRNTVRKVLQLLTDEGLLTRKTGFGTFVVPPGKRPADKVKLRRILLASHARQNDYYTQRLISGILDYTFVYRSTVELVNYAQLTAPRMIDRYRNLKYDAIIHDRPDRSVHDMIRDFAAAGIPQVTINRTVDETPALYADYVDTIRQVVSFFWGIGCRRIHFVDMNLPSPLFADRQASFVKELANYGVPNPARYLYVNKTKRSPEEAFADYFKEHRDADAFFIINAMLEECVAVFDRCGVKIPRDLSVIKLDENLRNPRFLSFSLFREPVKELGFKAAESVFRIFSNEPPEKQIQYIPGELILRKSCRLPYNKQD